MRSCDRLPTALAARYQYRPWLLLGLIVAASSFALPSACASSKNCERNSDCDHAYCADGECRRDCLFSEVDCPPGYTCNVISRCVLDADSGLPEGSAGQGGNDAGKGGSGGVAGTGTGGVAGAAGTGGSAGSTAGAGGTSGEGQGGSGGTQAGGAGGGPAGSGGAPAQGREFDLCSADTDCSSGLSCQPMTVSGTKRCTRSCSGIGQCMIGTRCSKDSYCAFDDDGKTCNAPGQCNHTCVAGPGANYCTSECKSGSDCPAGWGCVDVSTTRVCLRLDIDCAQPSDCAGQYCDQNNLIVSGCSIPCKSSADCPQRGGSLPSWGCSGGMCVRPGDVFGPVAKDQVTQWACDSNSQPVNVCADGLTLDAPPALTCNETQTVPTKGLCMSSCRPSGGCGDHFACVGGLATIGGVVTPICVQTGFAEIGQFCAKNEDCVFGLCAQSKCSRDCSGDKVCPKGFQCTGGQCQ